MIIEKKTWPEKFQEILDGKKPFEIRLDDFNCLPGDVLILREWNPETKKYTGRKVKKTVTYVAKTKHMKFWTNEDIKKYGFQVIAFR